MNFPAEGGVGPWQPGSCRGAERTLVPWGAFTTAEAGRYWGTTWSLRTFFRLGLHEGLKILKAFSEGAKMVSLVPDFTAF